METGTENGKQMRFDKQAQKLYDCGSYIKGDVTP